MASRRLTSCVGVSIVDAMAITKLDLIGLNCPLPALKTRRALSRLTRGDRLQVHCSDPLAAIDIPHLVHGTGDRIERTEELGKCIIFLIEKASE
jgi:tRNA 2-thiouridine synthesizing protein A